MKVKLRTIMAGPDGTADAGSVLELDDDFAKELIKAGFAESLEAPAERAEKPKRGQTTEKP
jgi:hypothetical protein